MSEEQILWEEQDVARGVARYQREQDILRGTRIERVDAFKYVMSQGIADAAYSLDRALLRTRGVHATENRLLRTLCMDDFTKPIYIGIRAILANVQKNKIMTTTPLCKQIGASIELEYMAMLFEKQQNPYYEAMMKDQRSRNSSVAHVQRAMRESFHMFELDWAEWSDIIKVRIGSRIVDVIIEQFPDVFYIRKTIRKPSSIMTTAEFDVWVQEFESCRGEFNPMRLPLKVLPLDWDEDYRGGYHTYKLQRSTPFIRTLSKAHKRHLRGKKPELHRKAANIMQKTAWRVNTRVLDVQEHMFRNNLAVGIPPSQPLEKPQFPEHLDKDKTTYTDAEREELAMWKAEAFTMVNLELKRKAKVVNFHQAFHLAQELRDWEKFFFVYSSDFRGRFYCATTGLSPQGQDSAKGLLQFAEGTPVDSIEAMRWLAIHGANVFGEDKLSYDDRVQWVHNNKEMILAIAEDPIQYHQLWGNADKPYQFLAWCIDWVGVDCGENLSALSYIPVAMDGSCNGLQHFSAMFRDEVGAKATNLYDSVEPQDIYQQVADLVNARQSRFLVTRAAVKRQVMTMPYGATQRSCTEYTWEWVREMQGTTFMEAVKLSNVIWEAIGDVVVKAREAMDWLRSIPNQFAKLETPVSNFPLYQDYPALGDVQIIKTAMQGGMKLSVGRLDHSTPAMRPQRNGISPNVVHSLDSTHLALVVTDLGEIPLAMIHDDFGTTAKYAPLMAESIRSQFEYMYSQDVIPSIQKQLQLKEAPPVGNYDLKEIHNARYFFG